MTTRRIALSFSGTHGQANRDRQFFVTVHAAQKDRMLSAARMAIGACARKNKSMHILGLWKSNGKGSSCFSPLMKKPNCQSCCLFGDPSAMQKEWANGASGNLNNFEVKIKSHEKTQAHLDGRRVNALIATDATFWRKYLLWTINIVLTLAMMSLALRGHRKHVGNGDCHCGNFLALVAPSRRIYFKPRLEQRSIGTRRDYPNRKVFIPRPDRGPT